MVNDLTHDPVYLQYPNYTVEEKITDHGDNFFGNISFKYYHTNSAAYILLATWFNYLRQEGVWDNTRIIIVSDHGDTGITHPGFSNFQNNHVLPYNPILLFKDFGGDGALKTNNDFMANADGRANTSFYTGTTCLEDNSKFFYVRDSIFDSENWTELRYKDFKDKK